MKIIKKPLAELQPPEQNVRMHPDKQMKEFCRSVKMFGQIRPIVIDETGTILAGNGLFEALLSIGCTEADCYMVSGLTEAQKKKLMLADNRVFDLGVDDLSVFEAFVQDLKDDLDIPGYEEDLLRAMVMDAEEASQALCEYGIIEQEQADTIIETHQRYEVQDTQVLPSIRKHGMYVVDQLISNPDLAIQAFTALKEEREQRKAFALRRLPNGLTGLLRNCPQKRPAGLLSRLSCALRHVRFPGKKQDQYLPPRIP